MPGLLNTLFGGDGESASESQSSQSDAGADGGVDLSPTVGVSHEADASWEDADGATHTWSSDIDLVFTADIDATFAAAGSLGQGSEEA